MADCSKCNKCKSECGCSGDILTTALTCTFPECANPNTCSETFSSDCVIYTGDEIADLGIPKGANLSAILQKLIGAILNPGCNMPTSPCLSVIGFFSMNIAKTTATFSWGALVGATSYQLEYRLKTSPTWLSNPAVVTTSDSIGPLVANSEYYVRVKSTCGVNACYSVTLLIKTKTD